MPWQVALVRQGSSTPFCGGTLISPNHVLTAAHCTGAYGGIWDVIVAKNSRTSSSDGTRHTKSDYQNHPRYGQDGHGKNNDLAIVTLTEAVQIGSRVNYACLPSEEMGGDFLVGKNTTLSGWGRLDDAVTRPSVLHTATLPVLSNEDCKRQWGRLYQSITDKMLCAGQRGLNKTGSCFGDSGGKKSFYFRRKFQKY